MSFLSITSEACTCKRVMKKITKLPQVCFNVHLIKCLLLNGKILSFSKRINTIFYSGFFDQWQIILLGGFMGQTQKHSIHYTNKFNRYLFQYKIFLICSWSVLLKINCIQGVLMQAAKMVKGRQYRSKKRSNCVLAIEKHFNA